MFTSLHDYFPNKAATITLIILHSNKQHRMRFIRIRRVNIDFATAPQSFHKRTIHGAVTAGRLSEISYNPGYGGQLGR